jgi:hypothetical protein
MPPLNKRCIARSSPQISLVCGQLFSSLFFFDPNKFLRIPPDLSPVSIRLALLFLLLTRGAR